MAPANPAVERPHVLLIEDDAALTRAVQDYLAHAGFRVTTGADNPAASEVDIIVSDYRLSGQATGTEAIAGLRARAGREIPAILFTGDVGGNAARDARQMSAVKLLLKPVRMDVLVGEIREMLERAR